jgi:glucose/arabinose dehydrogenase
MRLYSLSVRAGLALLFAAAAVVGGRTQGQPKVTGQPVGAGRVQLESIKLPPGFRISLFADGVKNARSMALSPGGTLFVGSRNAGAVYAMVDKNKDGRADGVMTVATGLTEPNGVAVHNGALYVAERSRILRWDNIESRLDAPGAPAVVGEPFPTDALHGWKVIHFGPDGMLYVTVGAPCNICDRGDPYASIIRMKPDGSGREIFARGIRNTVGFDWHPTTRSLWFTDNGRDNLGDENPNDELNSAPKAGLHFGYPYCHQGNTPDPEFGAKRMCSEFQAPAQFMGPHVAAIGMRFYTGTSFPQEYRNAIIVAQHGSWNRSSRAGYRVMVAILDPSGTKVARYEPLATGWLVNDREVLGRPVDVQVMPDGSLLVSDDFANAIYRITYQGK